jgi:signal transduction histidine kinase
LPSDTLIFFSTFFVDGRGRSFIPRDVLKLISDEGRFPVFGPYESYLGHGIIGGPLTSLRLQGKRAAEVAIQILRGTPAGEIPFDYGLGTMVNEYDWRQLQKWNIKESDLPSGSEVRYRQLSIWELYRAQAIAVIALIAFESLLIVTLLVNLQKRKRAEISLRESRQDLRTLAGRLISAREEELSRLSREFHDDIAQRLAAAAIEAGKLETRKTGIEESALKKIGSMKDQLIALSEDVHAISRQIHPSILKDLGLVRAVTSLCVRFSDRENIPVDFLHEHVPDVIRKDVALCLYRVIQESLRNVAKHAKATQVSILLRGLDGHIFLRIKDNGIGFVPQGVRQTPGIGLASMRERLDYIKGSLSIKSEPGHGTVIEISAPLGGETNETGKSAFSR